MWSEKTLPNGRLSKSTSGSLLRSTFSILISTVSAIIPCLFVLVKATKDGDCPDFKVREDNETKGVFQPLLAVILLSKKQLSRVNVQNSSPYLAHSLGLFTIFEL